MALGHAGGIADPMRTEVVRRNRAARRRAAVPGRAGCPAARTARRRPRRAFAIQRSSEASLVAAEDEEIPSDIASAPYQQTLNRSFVVGGEGLHEGRYACVRVLPAFGGDGRYFVRVPEGTNRHLDLGTALEEPEPVLVRDDDMQRKKQVFHYSEFMRAKEQGFIGTFEEYLIERNIVEDFTGYKYPELSNAVEAPRPKDTADGPVCDAVVDNILGLSQFTTALGTCEEDSVAGVEMLLAALEGCHVDNARIEIEGGHEVPVLDGSAKPWVTRIAEVGLRPAVNEQGRAVRKMAWLFDHPIQACNEDSSVSFFPQFLDRRLSFGVHMDPQVLKRQWITFDASPVAPPHLMPFALDFAPARMWLRGIQDLYTGKRGGYFQGNTGAALLLAQDETWLLEHGKELRWQDEAVRFGVSNMLGHLALLAEAGNSGIPCGHVVAHNADNQSFQDFVMLVRQCIRAGDVREFPWMMTEEECERFAAEVDAMPD